jgi:polyhydroxyalkanoate synthesis regulator phasin
VTTAATDTRAVGTDFFCDVFGAQIDSEARMIRGAAIMQIGQVNDDRPFYVDDVTLRQVMQMANNSLRSRVTHEGTVGTHVGRWSNFRIEGDTLRADLTISEVAFKTRGPATDDSNLGEYLLTLAAEDPQALGVSIHPRLDRPAMRKARRADGLMPVRIMALRAADIVDTPAATRTGLFTIDDEPETITPVTTKKGHPMKILLKDDGSFSVIDADGNEIPSETTLASLQLTAEQLQAHCKDTVLVVAGELSAADCDELRTNLFSQIDKLSDQFSDATLTDIAGVIKGDQTVEAFRASSAESRVAALEAELETERQKQRTPGFSASDDAGSGDGGSNSTHKQAWDKNVDGCQDEFASFDEYEAFSIAVERGQIR